MIQFLLDTNIVIYTMKSRPPEVREKFERHQDQICVSSVTMMELYYGVERSSDTQRNLKVVEGLVARMACIDYDIEAASHTAEIRAQLASAGKPICPYDAMLAGHARSRGLILVTNNQREFERVEGLRLANWVG